MGNWGVGGMGNDIAWLHDCMGVIWFVILNIVIWNLFVFCTLAPTFF
jgi:hypothetical protein